ncbi:hypothetical protein, partial [Bradyrhizobium sp. 177]|uniref:hypothetical protein n=1 Tax=Bradyrhizobium sp. 177 TaxID=2782647 RepID=UPI001FFBAB8C
RVAAFVRIGWPLSIGIGGRLPSESVAALPRIPHHGEGRPFSFVVAAARAAPLSAAAMVFDRVLKGSFPFGALRPDDLDTLVTSLRSLPQLAHS